MVPVLLVHVYMWDHIYRLVFSIAVQFGLYMYMYMHSHILLAASSTTVVYILCITRMTNTTASEP